MGERKSSGGTVTQNGASACSRASTWPRLNALTRLGVVFLLALLLSSGTVPPAAAESSKPAAACPTGQPSFAAPAYLSLGSPFATVKADRIDPTVLYGATNRFGNLHTGFDMPAKLSTLLYAPAAGRVLLAGPDESQRYSPQANYYGKMVVLQVAAPAAGRTGAGALYVIYGHLDRVVVKTGQQVKAGEHIGYVGMTGVAVGPHLHLEVRYPSVQFSDTRNPALWLAPAAGAGVIAGQLRDANGKPLPAARLLVYRLAAKQTLWRVIYTYTVGKGVQSDPAWQDNFALPDAPAGKYRLVVGQGANARQVDVTVTTGGLTFVQMQLGQSTAATTCNWTPETAAGKGNQ